jgi:hypothetical protein
MVMSSMKKEAAPPAEAVTAPWGGKERGERLGEKNNQCVTTHRSLEGLGYLGMLSALPTDMGAACFIGFRGTSAKRPCAVPVLAGTRPQK